MNTKYGVLNVDIDPYFNQLINRVFKLLPLREEQNTGLDRYIESLIAELFGVKELFLMVDDAYLVSLLATLESLKLLDFQQYRREVFKCIGLVQRLTEG
jgi:hypothetical protein